MLRRNCPVVKSVESVLRLEGSLWWERFVKDVCNDMQRVGQANWRKTAMDSACFTRLRMLFYDTMLFFDYLF